MWGRGLGAYGDHGGGLGRLGLSPPAFARRWKPGLLTSWVVALSVWICSKDHGPLLRAPHAEAHGSGLFEVRIKSHSGIGRAFYCYCKERVITVCSTPS